MNFFIGFATLEAFLSNLAANAEVYLFSHGEVTDTERGEQVENFLTLAEVRDGRCFYWQAMTGATPFRGGSRESSNLHGHARTTVFKADIRRDVEAFNKDLRIVEAQVAFPTGYGFVRGKATAYRLNRQTDLFEKIIDVAADTSSSADA